MDTNFPIMLWIFMIFSEEYFMIILCIEAGMVEGGRPMPLRIEDKGPPWHG